MDTMTIHPKHRMYQTGVTVVGLAAWLACAAWLAGGYNWAGQLSFFAFVPAIIFASMFVQTFRMPAGLRFTHERLTFTLSDALVLLVACWYGFAPAVCLAGIEGFTTSRRTVRRASSNLFSAGMMALAAAAAAGALRLVLRQGFHEAGTGAEHTALAVSVAMFVASLTHTVVNLSLLCTLLALRHDKSIMQGCLEKLRWAAPMFFPVGTAATLMYVARQHDMMFVVVTGLPVFLAIHFGHRRYRDGVQARIAFMEKAHRETIEALAVAINAKDQVTHEHVLRVQIYAAGVARLLGCSAEEVEALRAGALLHDIGKIAVPDYILNKPGKLTAAEFEQMKLHTVVGAQILGRVEFPYPVVPVVRHHHERWDGAGYPDGLKAEEIPLTARILSVVDCFDAVREDRQYRRGLTREEAVALIMEGAGTQYDPRVVGTFVTNLPLFEAEIKARAQEPLPTYGIEQTEQLSERAKTVAPAAGLAAAAPEADAPEHKLGERELQQLAQLAHAVEGLATQEEMLAAFARGLRALVPYDTCAVALARAETGDAAVAHAAGLHATALRNHAYTPGEGVTGWVLSNLRPFANTDPKLDFAPALATQFAGYRTLACVPVRGGRETLGTITLYAQALAAYSVPQQKLLEAAAMILATALAPKPVRAEVEYAAEPHASQPPADINLLNNTIESELTH
ncbi:MAG TPA: HD domain-containing phosphohydrolase [Pyrinomonadaceae bacterium]|jgi:putative nucleotidyltransferase with HDIG domain